MYSGRGLIDDQKRFLEVERKGYTDYPPDWRQQQWECIALLVFSPPLQKQYIHYLFDLGILFGWLAISITTEWEMWLAYIA